MPEVATSVRFTDKEIRDLLKAEAERALPAGNRGSVKIELYATKKLEGNSSDTIIADQITGEVSFNGVTTRK